MRIIIGFCIVFVVCSFKFNHSQFGRIIGTSRFVDSLSDSVVECPLVIQLRQDVRKATLSKDKSKVEAIQTIIAALQRKEIDDRVPMT